MDNYEDAIDLCPETETKHLSLLFSNLAICYSKQVSFLQYRWGPIVERLGELHYQRDEFDQIWFQSLEAVMDASGGIFYDREARGSSGRQIHYSPRFDFLIDYKACQKICPSDAMINKKVMEYTHKVEELNEKRKNEALKTLKDLGNSLLGKIGLSLDNFKMEQNSNGSYNIQFKQ